MTAELETHGASAGRALPVQTSAGNTRTNRWRHDAPDIDSVLNAAALVAAARFQQDDTYRKLKERKT
ncbi:hypothetical protein [Saccharopolyspora griseoalba]|uniref:Uncharacterized protein n=1 Tax=Saccharopolyspora griseoalba TaxID=1431848 RepID=A0ABW2LPU4_9PSEU